MLRCPPILFFPFGENAPFRTFLCLTSNLYESLTTLHNLKIHWDFKIVNMERMNECAFILNVIFSSSMNKVCLIKIFPGRDLLCVEFRFMYPSFLFHRGDRYDALRICIGDAKCQMLGDTNLFMVMYDTFQAALNSHMLNVLEIFVDSQSFSFVICSISVTTQ